MYLFCILSRYVSKHWERTDTNQQETVKFLNIWHGQCPYVSMCFRRKSSSSSHELGFQFFVYQENLEADGEKMVVHITEDPSALPVMRTCEKHKNEQIQYHFKMSPTSPEIRQIILDFNERKQDGVEHVMNTMPNRNIPHSIRAKLKLYLDPPNAFDNNWKNLASHLGMDNMIPVLEQKISPTECLLGVIDERKITLSEIHVSIAYRLGKPTNDYHVIPALYITLT